MKKMQLRHKRMKKQKGPRKKKLNRGAGEREARVIFLKKILKGLKAFSQQLLGAPAKLLGASSSARLVGP